MFRPIVLTGTAEVGGAWHGPGSRLHLADADADALIAEGKAAEAGAAQAGAAQASPPAPKPKKKAGQVAATIRAIQDLQAAGQLDPENPDHMTEDGRPHVRYLGATLGWEPSAAVRDEAWGQVTGDAG